MADERDFEAEAKAEGWVPQDQYKGDPARFISAEDFVKRGETITPILNARLKKEREKVTDLERRFQEREGVFAEFQTFQEKALKKANEERAEAIAELEAARTKAVTDGDGQAFTQADAKLQKLREEEPPPKKEEQRDSPAVTAWKTENPWYGTDMELTDIADGLSNSVGRENPGLKGKAFLDKLTERVKAVVPKKFENPRRGEKLVEDGNRKRSEKDKGYDDLPDDARKACEKFVKTIPGFTKEKYLSTYDWRE